MKKACLALVLVLCLVTWAYGESDFEDLSLNSESFYNGSDFAGTFTSGDASFNNYFDDTYGAYWEGFAYSNMTDTTTAGYTNQYSAIAGEGTDGSANYAVGYIGYMATTPEITLTNPAVVNGLYITNTTYAYLSMRDGDGVAKKFGGVSGDDPDYFKLTITGRNGVGAKTGEVEFYLADFRNDDNSLDYIVDKWTWIDLRRLGVVETVEFSLESTDNDPVYGMNTPAYFALDDFDVTPPVTGQFTFEDLSLNSESFYNGSDFAGTFTSGDASFNNYFDDTYGAYWEGFAYSNMTDTTTAGYTNQYSAIAGEGTDGSANYAVGYIGYMATTPEITLTNPAVVNGLYITNTTYAYLSMRDGDGVAKKFGGVSGDDPDYFKLTITGRNGVGAKTGEVEFYLADFRNDDNSLDYIVDKWTWIDLRRLGVVETVEFSLESTDNDPVYGMNTPAYFAIDGTEATDNPADNPSSGGSGGSGGCFISSAQKARPAIGPLFAVIMLLAGLCILRVDKK